MEAQALPGSRLIGVARLRQDRNSSARLLDILEDRNSTLKAAPVRDMHMQV